MKLLGLLVVVIALSISSFAASGESTQSPPVSAAPVFKIGSLSLNTGSTAKPLFEWPAQDGYEVRSRSAENTTCYKMRAYYVARESRDSDVTRPDGYSTCQAASQFQVKRAIGQRMIEERNTAPGTVLTH